MQILNLCNLYILNDVTVVASRGRGCCDNVTGEIFQYVLREKVNQTRAFRAPKSRRATCPGRFTQSTEKCGDRVHPELHDTYTRYNNSKATKACYKGGKMPYLMQGMILFNFYFIFP